MGFFRTSMNALFEVSGPTLRLERRDSRRDFTTGRAVGTPKDPRPVWTTRLTGASPAARSHNSSITAGSSVGREERLHVDGSGVFTSSRISSLDLGGLSDCPAALPPGLSSGQRGNFSMLPVTAGFPSDATTEDDTRHLSKYYTDLRATTLNLLNHCWVQTKVWVFVSFG